MLPLLPTEEGGGIKDNDDNKYHEGGGGRKRGHCRVVIAPSSFDAAGAIANVKVAVITIGIDKGVPVPQRYADIAGLVFQYLLIGMYSFR